MPFAAAFYAYLGVYLLLELFVEFLARGYDCDCDRLAEAEEEPEDDFEGLPRCGSATGAA